MAHSKIGFHVGSGGNHNGIGDWLRRVNGDRVPVGLKSVDHYGRLEEALQIGRDNGVDNWLVYRMTRGNLSREVPNYTTNPQDDAVALCEEAIGKLPPTFDKAVWLELVNEVRGKLSDDDQMFNNMRACDYMGEWCLAAAKYLNARGYKFAGPAFNSGEPGKDRDLASAVAYYSEPGMLNYLRYCAANPTMAALAVHEYVWDRWLQGETVADWYPNFWGRFEAAIAAADLHGIPRTFPIFVTEFGVGFEIAPDLEKARPMLDARNRMLARFPQVKFDAAWALQEYGQNSSEVSNNVNSWMGYYQTGQTFAEGSQPARTDAVFGGTLPGDGNLPPPSPPPDTFSEGDTLYVASTGLNLREGPSVEHTIITALSQGTAVTILEPGGWARVQANGHTGFVASRYLSATQPGA